MVKRIQTFFFSVLKLTVLLAQLYLTVNPTSTSERRNFPVTFIVLEIENSWNWHLAHGGDGVCWPFKSIWPADHNTECLTFRKYKVKFVIPKEESTWRKKYVVVMWEEQERGDAWRNNQEWEGRKSEEENVAKKLRRITNNNYQSPWLRQFACVRLYNSNHPQ